MLRIRKEQMQAFDDASAPSFENHMIEHLREFTPLHSGILGEDGLRKMIQSGVARGETYGLTRRGPVKFYIEMFFLLGFDFDTDPQYHVLGSILNDNSISDQIERADLMYEEVMQYLTTVAGPDRSLTKRALRKARELPYEGIPRSTPDYDEQVLLKLRGMRPEKYEYVGIAPLKKLIDRARSDADKYSVSSDAGLALFIGLMYSLGHGVIRDPKYAFIERTLNNAMIRQDLRAERVYSKMMTYLDHVLEHIGG